MKLSLGIVLLFGALQSAEAQYKTSPDIMCDGFPQVQVGSFKDSCVGLAADKTLKDERTQETFVFPRKIVELTSKRFLILDMGGWSPPTRGALWELDLRGPSKKLWKLVKGLRLPHGLAWGPDGNLYVGESHRIVRYSKEALLKRQTLVPEVVIDNLKTENSTSMHPLSNFTFGQSSADFGDLYVNIGAPTDACVKDAPNKCSVEGKQGVIRRYRYQTGLGRYSSEFTVVSKGLRNSMGLVSHPSGVLLQVENSRDFSEANEPFDELNVVVQDKHYGWPYCYNFLATSPEWKNVISCKEGFQTPLLLFPPHSAPLDMTYYKGAMFPELQGQLLISWHGYKPTGSRIVSLRTDEEGIPLYENNAQWEYGFGNMKQTARPEGGSLRATSYLEVISTWDKKDGVRPAGSPVGVLVASDGSIFVVEDKNKTILRIAKGSNRELPDELPSETEAEKKARVENAVKKLKANAAMFEGYNWINKNVFQSSCTTCHGQVKGTGTEAFEFMIGEKWIEPGSADSLLIQRIRGLNGLNRMPLGGELHPKTIQYIEDWIKRL